MFNKFDIYLKKWYANGKKMFLSQTDFQFGVKNLLQTFTSAGKMEPKVLWNQIKSISDESLGPWAVTKFFVDIINHIGICEFINIYQCARM